MSALLAIVVAKLELRDIERQILRADLVERANDTALEDRPETFNRVGMDRADDILAGRVANNAMREIGFQATIASPFIRNQKADLLGYSRRAQRI